MTPEERKKILARAAIIGARIDEHELAELRAYREWSLEDKEAAREAGDTAAESVAERDACAADWAIAAALQARGANRIPLDGPPTQRPGKGGARGAEDPADTDARAAYNDDLAHGRGE